MSVLGINDSFFFQAFNCLRDRRYYPATKVLIYLHVILCQQSLERIFSKKYITVWDCGHCMLEIKNVIPFQPLRFIPAH
jgi:hypothetical protein